MRTPAGLPARFLLFICSPHYTIAVKIGMRKNFSGCSVERASASGTIKKGFEAALQFGSGADFAFPDDKAAPARCR